MVDAGSGRSRVSENLYDVVAEVVIKGEDEVVLDVAGQSVVSLASRDLSRIAVGTCVQGRAWGEFSAMWGGLDESPHREFFLVQEILARSSTGELWLPVDEVGSPGVVYQVRCEPSA